MKIIPLVAEHLQALPTADLNRLVESIDPEKLADDTLDALATELERRATRLKAHAAEIQLYVDARK